MSDQNKSVKETISGGALREERGVDYSQISHHALRLMAETQHEGNTRYGYGNWQKGLPISNLLSHGIEHILKFQNGDTSEGGDVMRHLAHALWNFEKIAHFIGTRREELIDIAPLRAALNHDTRWCTFTAANPNHTGDKVRCILPVGHEGPHQLGGK